MGRSILSWRKFLIVPTSGHTTSRHSATSSMQTLPAPAKYPRSFGYRSRSIIRELLNGPGNVKWPPNGQHRLRLKWRSIELAWRNRLAKNLSVITLTRLSSRSNIRGILERMNRGPTGFMICSPTERRYARLKWRLPRPITCDCWAMKQGHTAKPVQTLTSE